MIVEDEGIVSLDLKHLLQSLGYEVIAIAASAQEAIGEFVQAHPDLILMDIRINGTIDGIEVARFLYEHYDVPIVYLTALIDVNTFNRANSTKYYGYVVKPYDEIRLQEVIEAALEKHRTEKEEQAQRIANSES
jgi:CheY-like chemotaxis protein